MIKLENIAEVICVFVIKEKNKYNPVKMKENYYNITNISYRLKADSVKYTHYIFKRRPKRIIHSNK